MLIVQTLHPNKVYSSRVIKKSFRKQNTSKNKMYQNLKHCIPFYSSVTVDTTAFLLFCSSTKYKRKIITYFLKFALSIRWVKFTKEIKMEI